MPAPGGSERTPQRRRRHPDSLVIGYARHETLTGPGMSKLHFSEHAEPMRFMAASTAPLGGVLLALLALWMAAVPPSLHEIGFDLPGDGCVGVMGPEGPPVHIVIIDQ